MLGAALQVGPTARAPSAEVSDLGFLATRYWGSVAHRLPNVLPALSPCYACPPLLLQLLVLASSPLLLASIRKGSLPLAQSTSVCGLVMGLAWQLSLPLQGAGLSAHPSRASQGLAPEQAKGTLATVATCSH
jgi:hypothetical protein